MITTKLQWYFLNEGKPIECRDILFSTIDGVVHSGYLLNDEYVEPYDDGEPLRYEPEKVSMWAYRPQTKNLRYTVKCHWYPYKRRYEPSMTEPWDYQTILFVSDTVGGKPKVYCGYYRSPTETFVTFEEDWQFSGEEVQFWMPLPPPPKGDDDDE